MNNLGAARMIGIKIVALVALLSGCGSDPLRSDGGQTGSGGLGHAGAGGGSGSGGTSDGRDAKIDPGTGGAARDAGSGGTVGLGGATGLGGAIGVGGRTGSGGATGSGGVSGSCGKCAGSLKCCGDQCLDLGSNQFNCGSCGKSCPSDKPFCAGGVCGPVPCGDQVYPAHTCQTGSFCCGRECCQSDQICCDLSGSIDFPGCYTPTAQEPSCPTGCGPLGLCASDRNIKRDLEPVDPQQVLTKVSQLPISTWQYLSDPVSVRHMGPMAQDFKQAFGLGASDRVYNSIDGHGVALASIQALAKLAAEQRQRFDLLQRKNDILERRLRALEGKATRTLKP